MDRIPKCKLKVGMKLWIKTIGNKARYATEIYETEVTKIGRKYFYLDGLECHKFNFTTGMEETEYCKNHMVYFTKQEILDEQESIKLRGKIREAFGLLSKKNFTLEQLQQVEKIIDGVDENGR